MIRRKGPILAAAVIAAFALGWYRGLFGLDQSATEPARVTERAIGDAGSTATNGAAPEIAAVGAGQGSAPTSQAAETGDAGPASNTAEQAAIASTPLGFDVVRVEPDGSAVVAGRGAANERIALTDGTRTLGETRTDANGDFVIALSLPTGSHRLQLAQKDDALSTDTAVVNVPPPGRPDELLVMMQKPGEASEILQRPTATMPIVADAASVEAPDAAAGTATESGDERMASVEPTESGATPAVSDGGLPRDLSVEAVEIEGGKVFIAGAAKPTSTVRVYIDDKFIAETKGGSGERFIASAMAEVSVGDHVVRADEVDANGRVVGRVEVPFQRPDRSSMAAVVAAPAKEPVATETAAATSPATAEGIDRSSSAASGVEPATVVQSPLQTVDARVIIRRGDTLWRISRNTYGRGSRYTVIYLANGDQIRDPNRIYPGQVFRMPRDEDEDAASRG